MSLEGEISNTLERYKDMVRSLDSMIARTDNKADMMKGLMRRQAYLHDMIPDLEHLLEVARAGRNNWLPNEGGKE